MEYEQNGLVHFLSNEHEQSGHDQNILLRPNVQPQQVGLASQIVFLKNTNGPVIPALHSPL